MAKRRYHELYVWQRANELVELVYARTKEFPSEERYGMTSQLRRASVSIVLNVVEGQARGTTRDFIRFLLISRGSLAESSYLIELAGRLGYFSEEDCRILEGKLDETSFLLQRMITQLSLKLSQEP